MATLFFSYSDADENLRDQSEIHLSSLPDTPVWLIGDAPGCAESRFAVARIGGTPSRGDYRSRAGLLFGVEEP